jgi:hypothetical protein
VAHARHGTTLRWRGLLAKGAVAKKASLSGGRGGHQPGAVYEEFATGWVHKLAECGVSLAEPERLAILGNL